MSPESLLIASLPSLARGAQAAVAGISEAVQELTSESPGFAKLLGSGEEVGSEAGENSALTLEGIANRLRETLSEAGFKSPFSIAFTGSSVEVEGAEAQAISDQLAAEPKLLSDLINLGRRLTSEPLAPSKIRISG